MRVLLTVEAEADLADARDWYDGEAPGIGQRFMAEFRLAAERLADNPLLYPTVRRDIRRAGFRHFPYGLFFRIRGEVVEVFACLHGSRHPRHWQRRS